MSRFAKFFLALLTLAALIGAVFRVQDVLAKDPFASFKTKNLFGDLGIQLTDVKVKHYSGGKLLGVADVDRIDVRQDRTFLDFHGIKKGHFESKRGEFAFTAQEANYNTVAHQFLVTSTTNVTNKDMDVVTPAFMYQQDTGILSMPGQVQGKFYDGTIKGANLSYNSEDDTAQIQTIDWNGVPPSDAVSELAVQEAKPKPWHISGHDFQGNGLIESYHDATATDGDILVKTPYLEHDKKTDVLTCTGPVHYFGQKSNLICDKAVINRKKKLAILTGNVHMLVKAKGQESLDMTDIDQQPFHPVVPTSIATARPQAPDSPEAQQEKDLDDELRSSKTVRRYPMRVKANQIEYWYHKGERHAIITGSPDSYQELPGQRWRHVVTFKALYDGENDVLTMQSSPDKKDTVMADSLGDNMRAVSVTLSTKDDDDDLNSYSAQKPDGEVYPDDEDINTATNSNGSAPASGGGTPPSGKTPLPAGPIPAAPQPAPTGGGKGGGR
jgi:hypothetical protein